MPTTSVTPPRGGNHRRVKWQWQPKLNLRVLIAYILTVVNLFWSFPGAPPPLLRDGGGTPWPASGMTDKIQCPISIVILAKNRPSSLQRLLVSISAAKYGNTKIPHAKILIDGAYVETQRVADVWEWPSKSVTHTKAGGLRAAWLGAWKPSSNKRGQWAIILEDDIELSPSWHNWLTKAWEAYSDRPDLAGISLQRQTLVPKQPSKSMEIVNDHKPFLYRLVGSIGFSPHPDRWSEFLEWIESKDLETFDAKVEGLVTSDWYQTVDKKSMWTQLFIRFCEERGLYTLFVNLPESKTLAAHWREKGEHHSGSEGRDFAVATDVKIELPEVLRKYDWDAREEKTHLGGWQKLQTASKTNPDKNVTGLDILDAASQIAGAAHGAWESWKKGSAKEHAKIQVGIPDESKVDSQFSEEVVKGKVDEIGLLDMAVRIHKEYNLVVLQLLNEGFVEMTKSWVCNVRSFGVLAKTLFVATDIGAYDALTAFDPALNVIFKPFHSPTVLKYGQTKYFNYMLFRTGLISVLLSANLTLWLTESDAVWVRNPTSYVLNATGDLVTMSDDMPPLHKLQGGFLLLRPTATAKRLWTRMLSGFTANMNEILKRGEIKDDIRGTSSEPLLNEQHMLQKLIQEDREIRVSWLDPSMFVAGRWYTTAEYRNIAPDPVVILNNWIVGNSAKIKRARAWSHWHLLSNGTCKEANVDTKLQTL